MGAGVLAACGWNLWKTAGCWPPILRVTELMADNGRTLQDGDGNWSDWIEIANLGDEPTDLAGWHLTDDRRLPGKWTFPSRVVGPGEFVIVFASGQSEDTYVDFAGQLHANFRLAGDGEYLALTGPDLAVVDEYSPGFPAQVEDISFGWSVTSAGRTGVYFEHPTPGAVNAVGFAGVTQDEVRFTRDSGTFQEAFSLSLQSDAPGAAIHYTTDGSLPNDRSTRYAGPIQVDRSSQVRARVIEPDKVPGPVSTQSYLRIDADVAAFTSQLPIMVIDNFGAGHSQQGLEFHWVGHPRSGPPGSSADVVRAGGGREPPGTAGGSRFSHWHPRARR